MKKLLFTHIVIITCITIHTNIQPSAHKPLDFPIITTDNSQLFLIEKQLCYLEETPNKIKEFELEFTYKGIKKISSKIIGLPYEETVQYKRFIVIAEKNNYMEKLKLWDQKKY